MNPKCLGTSFPDTFGAKSADFTGLKMRRITRAASFDHLVGADEQRWWDFEAERPCSLEVDHELELGPLLHRQVSWFCSFEDFVDEAGRAVPHVFDASQIGEQATCLSHLPHSADQRQTVARRRRHRGTRSDESSIIQQEK